jgi:hypothetical protein
VNKIEILLTSLDAKFLHKLLLNHPDVVAHTKCPELNWRVEAGKSRPAWAI